MKYQSLEETRQIVRDLVSRDDVCVSLYLPYGILGESEDKCRIARKNLSAAVLADPRLGKASLLRPRLSEIRDAVGDRGIQEQRSTRCLFLSQGSAVDIWLPGIVPPMFAIGRPAVEPLADYVSSVVDTYILVFDLKDTHLLRCRERNTQRVDWTVPSYLQPYYGEPERWSLEFVSKQRDKYEERRQMGQTRGGTPGYMAYSSREVSIKDRELFYFAHIINDLLSETWPNKNIPLHLAVNDQHRDLVNSALETQNLTAFPLTVDDVKSGKVYDLVDQKMQTERLAWWSQQLQQAHPDDVVRGPKEVKEQAICGRIGEVFLNRRLWQTDENGVTQIQSLEDEMHDAILAALATGAKLHCLPDGTAATPVELIGLKRVGRTGKVRQEQPTVGADKAS